MSLKSNFSALRTYVYALNEPENADELAGKTVLSELELVTCVLSLSLIVTSSVDWESNFGAFNFLIFERRENA